MYTHTYPIQSNQMPINDLFPIHFSSWVKVIFHSSKILCCPESHQAAGTDPANSPVRLLHFRPAFFQTSPEKIFSDCQRRRCGDGGWSRFLAQARGLFEFDEAERRQGNGEGHSAIPRRSWPPTATHGNLPSLLAHLSYLLLHPLPHNIDCVCLADSQIPIQALIKPSYSSDN